MNERIRELARTAGFSPFDSQSELAEKFAELIVRSCSNIAAHHNSLDVAEDIMKHFGVEE